MSLRLALAALPQRTLCFRQFAALRLWIGDRVGSRFLPWILISHRAKMNARKTVKPGNPTIKALFASCGQVQPSGPSPFGQHLASRSQ
jgi:hypothetical protein